MTRSRVIVMSISCFFILALIAVSVVVAQNNAHTYIALLPESKSNMQNKGVLKYIDSSNGEVDEDAVRQMTSKVPDYLNEVALSKSKKAVDKALSDGLMTTETAQALLDSIETNLYE